MTDTSKSQHPESDPKDLVGKFTDLIDRRIGGRMIEFADSLAERCGSGEMITIADLVSQLRLDGERLKQTYVHGRPDSV